MISSFIITGFLGAGKTTMLVNSAKQYFANKKVAIIVNEFGEIGVDSKILKNVHSEVLEISEGCVCCELISEFEDGVNEIIFKYSPEIILVETSGASEPFPILMSLQNLGVVVEGVICVVDSKNFSSYKENSSVKYQLGGSNIIVLNKTDLVSKDKLEELKNEINLIKQEYNIRNTVTNEPIFNNYLFYNGMNGIVNEEVFEGVISVNDFKVLVKDYQHLDHTSKDSLSQKVAYLKENVTISDIDLLLQSLPKNIYRVKGVIKTVDSDYPIFINYSFGEVSFDDIDNYTDKSILIFIGENITQDIFSLDDKFEFLMVPRFKLA